MRSFEELKTLSLGWTAKTGEPEWILELEGESDNPPMALYLGECSPLPAWEIAELVTLVVGLGLESLHIHAGFACASESGPYRMGVVVEKSHWRPSPYDGVPMVRLIVDAVVAPHWHVTPDAPPSTWRQTVETWLGTLPTSLTDALEVRDWTGEQFAEAYTKEWCSPDTGHAVWIGFREPPCEWVLS